MNEDVKKVVARILKDIQVEMSDEFDKNFERQAFFSEKWQRRKSPIRDEGRAILTDTGALRKSIGSRTTENSITFFTSLPYAAIHNDGGEIVVTGRMKRFFWHKYYEATGAFGRRKDGKLRKDKRNARLEGRRFVFLSIKDKRFLSIFWRWDRWSGFNDNRVFHEVERYTLFQVNGLWTKKYEGSLFFFETKCSFTFG